MIRPVSVNGKFALGTLSKQNFNFVHEMLRAFQLPAIYFHVTHRTRITRSSQTSLFMVIFHIELYKPMFQPEIKKSNVCFIIQPLRFLYLVFIFQKHTSGKRNRKMQIMRIGNETQEI